VGTHIWRSRVFGQAKFIKRCSLSEAFFKFDFRYSQVRTDKRESEREWAAMYRTRIERLRRLTGYEPGEDFADTPSEREELMIHLIQHLGNYEAAEKLREEIGIHKEKLYNARLNLDEKRLEVEEHRSFFIRCCCQVINRELRAGPEAFLEKDFQRHRFWTIVDACLVEIGLRKAREAEASGGNTPSKMANKPSLEERIAIYTATRPTMQFPTFVNMSDTERSLLADVLKDQRGLKRRPDLFSRGNCTLYDRRYVASLRAQVHAAESLAEARLGRVRELEERVRKLEAASGIPVHNVKIEDATPHTASRTERRRIAGELRDLAHQLAFLPDQMSEFLANERRFTAPRGSSAKPQFLEELIVLARGTSYDLTTLDLVDVGLCELDEQPAHESS
jgi:hypothetical protein